MRFSYKAHFPTNEVATDFCARSNEDFPEVIRAIIGDYSSQEVEIVLTCSTEKEKVQWLSFLMGAITVQRGHLYDEFGDALTITKIADDYQRVFGNAGIH